MPSLEPVVRVRCPTPEDEVRCREILERAGLALERQLTSLLVRDADPDAVNDLLVAGGAAGRAVAREQVGKLIGFLLDHEGRIAGREASLAATVARVLSTSGLERRWAPLPPEDLLRAAAELHEHLTASGGGFLPWERFLALFCRPAEGSRPPPP